MILYPTPEQVIHVQHRLIEAIGGSHGIRDLEAIRTTVELVQAQYFGEEAYPTLGAKAAYLAFSIIQNHPFVDGNKRTAYQVMKMFLYANRRQMRGSSIDERERLFLGVAAGDVGLDELTAWVEAHLC